MAVNKEHRVCLAFYFSELDLYGVMADITNMKGSIWTSSRGGA